MAPRKGDDEVLAAVGRTIYREGINATGVDRLSEVAGVSKRTLYQRYRSKDELVCRALAASDPAVGDSLLAPGDAVRAAGGSGVEQIVAVFRGLEEAVIRDGFRGCGFVNAALELSDVDHPAHAVVRDHKARVRTWFEEAARSAGAHDPASLARQLMVVLDGALVDAVLHSPVDVARDAQSIVDALLARATDSTITRAAARRRG